MLAPWLTPVMARRNSFNRAGIGIKRRERIGTAVFGFVLREPGAQRRREVAPVRIEAVVGHLEDAADVGGLALIEEEIGGRACCEYLPSRRSRNFSATSASRKSRADRG